MVNFVVRKGEITRVDGPYAEAREVVGGWAIMQYDTLEEVAWPPGRRGRLERTLMRRGLGVRVP